MKNKRKKIIINLTFIFFAIIFIIMVKFVDVKPIGVNGSNIGFSTLNQIILNQIGVNIIWYYITDWLGLIPILISLIYAIIGIIQLFNRKSIFKVDKEIISLGLFYITLICIYIFFENVIINYRPILIDGFLEASFPSSHTLMTVCICGSSIIINNKLFKNNIVKTLNILSIIIIIVTIFGRLVSGAHWFTDILGGIIISISLLKIFYFIIQNIDTSKN